MPWGGVGGGVSAQNVYVYVLFWFLKWHRLRNFQIKLLNSGPIRPRQGTEIYNFGAPSPLEALHWLFCSFSRFYLQFSKKSPRKSGESSEKSSGENRVKSYHVCGCHGFFGPDKQNSLAGAQFWHSGARFALKMTILGRAIHGPMPVQGETLEELSGPLVHTSFPWKRYGPRIGPYEFSPIFVWTNGAQSSLKVSVLTGIGP